GGKKYTFDEALTETFSEKLVKIRDGSEIDAFVLKENVNAGEVILFRISNHSCTKVINRITIAKSLSDLRNGEKNRTFGFVEIHNIVYVQEELPQNVQEAIINYQTSNPALSPPPNVR